MRRDLMWGPWWLVGRRERVGGVGGRGLCPEVQLGILRQPAPAWHAAEPL